MSYKINKFLFKILTASGRPNGWLFTKHGGVEFGTPKTSLSSGREEGLKSSTLTTSSHLPSEDNDCTVVKLKYLLQLYVATL